MGYFSTPIAVKALPDSNAVRVSVRASESRVDEWTILRQDVESVLSGYDDDFREWRGVGELRVRVGRSGGDVAFYDGDDRALLRLSPSEIASFLAHLSASVYELGGSVTTPTPAVAPPPRVPPQAVSIGQALPVASADVEVLRGMMQQIMMAVITLTSDVNRMMRQLAEREAERAIQAAPVVVMAAPTTALPVAVQPAAVAPTESEMFIPSMSQTDISGASLEAKEKTGAGDDLAAASAALKAAKKRRTKKKEEG